jgi:hypothetical protein
MVRRQQCFEPRKELRVPAIQTLVSTASVERINRVHRTRTTMDILETKGTAGCSKQPCHRQDVWRLVVQNNIQQRTVDLHIAIVFDKSQLSEFVHEMAYAGPRGANHLRKRLLTDFRYDRLRRSFLAKPCH